MGKNVSSKYSQKRLASFRKSTTDAIKTASKTEIQNTAEATGDLISNKSADKIIKTSQNNSKTGQNELYIPKGRYISPEKRH